MALIKYNNFIKIIDYKRIGDYTTILIPACDSFSLRIYNVNCIYLKSNCKLSIMDFFNESSYDITLGNDNVVMFIYKEDDRLYLYIDTNIVFSCDLKKESLKGEIFYPPTKYSILAKKYLLTNTNETKSIENDKFIVGLLDIVKYCHNEVFVNNSARTDVKIGVEAINYIYKADFIYLSRKSNLSLKFKNCIVSPSSISINNGSIIYNKMPYGVKIINNIAFINNDMIELQEFICANETTRTTYDGVIVLYQKI